MNVIILSPHFPFNHTRFCNRLHDLGVNVLAIDHVDQSELNCSLKGYYKVSDLNNTQELTQAFDHFIQSYGIIDRVESNNEHWLQVQAELRSKYNIPGMKNDQIQSIKKKSEMKKIYLAAGLSAAKGRLVPNLESALQLAKEIGYPVMVKPDIGVGGSGCQKIRNDEELRTFFRSPKQDYLMEEFIEGSLVSFDGLVDRDGKIVFYTVHICSAGIAEVVNHQLDYYFYSLRDIPTDLETIGRKTVKAFSVKESFFHLEYFRRHSDGKIVPIEVNIRAPGGGVVDMCNYACDIDLYMEWAKIVAGVNQPFSYERKYHCITVIRRYKNHYVHSHDEILEKWGHMIVHHEKTVPLNKATMGDYYYMARTSTFDELMSLQHFVQETDG